MLQDSYFELRKTNYPPRLPLCGNLDLTYRCNNNCRHCWLRIHPDSEEFRDELSFEEIRKIADEARKMGCRQWSISGGEPMLRTDFKDIFHYLTCDLNSYSINTNGTFITPKIARLLKKKGLKIISLYGATEEVHDHITRNPGSFESTMRGCRYLKEAGANFVVQIIPMRDNYHQFKKMVDLAESISKQHKIGAVWFYLSASGQKEKNCEIMHQRLSPRQAVEVDNPHISNMESATEPRTDDYLNKTKDRYLFSSCIARRRDFHIDPYGKMTFCCFIKDPALRYDLKKGNFKDCWEKFIPSLGSKIKISNEYKKNCGSCKYRQDCLMCPVYGYLEHKNFNAEVKYLCAIAKEKVKFKEEWKRQHRRYFKISGITIQVDSDLPITEKTFHQKFKIFESDGRGEDMIRIQHHFSLPDLDRKNPGKEIYRKPPWAIYKKEDNWTYLGILPRSNRNYMTAIFNSDHTSAQIYSDNGQLFLKGNLGSLTLFPSDQILLARILADRQGCLIHACGVILKGKGLLFVGHPEAGKSTMAAMLKGKGEILCDDRMIIRMHTTDKLKSNTFKIYGTWSHGDIPDVSANFADLKAIMFLEKSDENRIIRMDNKKEAFKMVSAHLIKPFVTVDWWEKTLSVVDKITQEVPCYILEFNKNGSIIDVLKKL